MRYHEVATIGDLLARNADQRGDVRAIVLEDGTHTHRGLFDRATAVAQSLLAFGIGRGDRVGVLMPNSMPYVDVLFGTWMLGAVAVPINARFRSRELRHVLPDAEVQLLFTSDLLEDEETHAERIVAAFPAIAEHDTGPDARARLAAEEVPDLRHVIMMGEATRPGMVARSTFEAAAHERSPDEVQERRARTSLRDLSTIFYTSGTTSLPKGCLLTHEALVREGLLTADRLGFEDGESLFSPLPMFHTAFTQALFAVLVRRGTYANMTYFEPERALEMIEQEQVTALYTAFPPVTEGLLNADSYTPDTFRNVRILFNVSPPDHLRSVQDRLPHTTLVNGYGMTEFSGSIVLTSPDASLEERLSQGPPLAGCELEIRDLETGEPAPVGQIGEVVGRGPVLFEGYLNAPERNAESFDDDGWFHTGDLGWLDEAGQLHFRGRLKDMLKIGGENVACVEIETHLQAHPAVKIAAVVGMPDERLDEVAAAFLELRPGASVTEQEIIDHCTGEIASFKVPRTVRFVEEGQWPMSATKIRKEALREQLLDEA